MFRKGLRIINLLVIILTFVAYLSAWTRPQTMSYLQFVGMAYPWLLLCNIMLIISWLRLGTKYYLFSLATILLGYSHFSHFVGWSIFEGSTKGTRLKIMTYNIDNFTYFLSQKNNEKQIAELEKFIKQQQPDIICLQEAFITSVEYQTKLKKFPALAAYQYVIHPVEKAMVILSKYPTIQSNQVLVTESKNVANGAIFADFVVNQQKIRLIVTHLQSNSIRNRAADIVENPNLRDEETQADLKAILRRIKDISYYRALQAEDLKAFIKKSPYPVIIAGDFNDTPQSYTYTQIADGLQDTFTERGFGLGTTYGGVIPALRIDYVLVSKKIDVLSHHIFARNFSDHYPVIVELGI